MMPELSILILTHERPNLFTRCLRSAINQLTPDVEVIVNNDSQDITVIPHEQVAYHYKKFEHLSEAYEFLLNQSTGKYVYFLEDDDYLASGFIRLVLENRGYDMLVGNYYPTFDPPWRIKAMTDIQPRQDYNINEELLQLGQHVFNRETIEDFVFPKDSDIHNDILLVKHCLDKHSAIKTFRNVFYYQTQDGGDNISFPESKKKKNGNN